MDADFPSAMNWNELMQASDVTKEVAESGYGVAQVVSLPDTSSGDNRYAITLAGPEALYALQHLVNAMNNLFDAAEAEAQSESSAAPN